MTAALDGERLECVVFNAARPGPSKFFEWTPEGLQSDLQVRYIQRLIAFV